MKTKLHLDHFIPLSWGHGGTYRANIIALKAHLNEAKKDKHPFLWAESELCPADRESFYRKANRIAELNGLTLAELKDFVTWCSEHKRTVEMVIADNEKYGYKKPSLELWRESTVTHEISDVA